MREIWCVAIIAIAWSPAASADELFAVTPSGASEVVFAENPAIVTGKISSKCIDAHWTIANSTDTEVTCESPLNFGQSVLGQVLLGNNNSTPPRRFFKFNVAQSSGTSRVQYSGWIELQMAFGQTRRTDLAGSSFQNSMMNFLIAAGGSYPNGTTFPHHAMLGVKGEDARQGKYDGLRITEIVPGSPAERAALQVGDVVIRIAGKQFKDANGYLEATAKAVASPSYPIEFIRDGKQLSATVERAFRPAIITQIGSAQSQSQNSPNTTSVADELERLVKLRDQGVLSATEFETAKARTLARQ